VRVRDPHDGGKTVVNTSSGPVQLENWKLQQCYVRCENITVIDFDHGGPLAEEVLEAIGDQCNCVALTNKGAHLYFQGATPELQGGQFDGIDARSARPGAEPDITFCPPSWYSKPGNGQDPEKVAKAGWSGTAKYQWVALPNNNEVLSLP